MRGVVAGWSMRLGLGRHEGVTGKMCCFVFPSSGAVFLLREGVVSVGRLDCSS
jgi:hypothetical protein